MSRISPNCKNAEDDVQIYTPKNTVQSPAPKTVKNRVIAGALCAAVLAGGGLSLWKLSRAHTPEKTAEAFRSALAANDAEALRRVADFPLEADVSADALEPMFTLYRQSAAFRQQAANLASADAPSLHLEKRRGFPFASYRVLVDTCSLDVTTNVSGANVTAGDVSAETQPLDESAGTLTPSAAEFDALLPGVYDVSVDYTSPLGESFEKSTTVNLMQPQSVNLDLDYTSLYVWNSSSIPVDLSVDGSYYGSLDAGGSVEIAPLLDESIVTASCKTDAGEVLTDSVTAASRSFEVLFSLGRVDVYNDYDADMRVTLNGADYCVIPEKTLQTISGISLGSMLTFTLADSDVFSPYDYQLVYDFDSICPILSLSEDSRLAVSAVLQDALSSAPLTGENDGLLSSLDHLLIENGWSRSEIVVSDVTVDAVYAMESEKDGTYLSLSGSYACTNITLPDTPVSEETKETDASPVENPQYQNFYATVLYDGENWSIAE